MSKYFEALNLAQSHLVSEQIMGIEMLKTFSANGCESALVDLVTLPRHVDRKLIGIDRRESGQILLRDALGGEVGSAIIIFHEYRDIFTLLEILGLFENLAMQGKSVQAYIDRLK